MSASPLKSPYIHPDRYSCNFLTIKREDDPTITEGASLLHRSVARSNSASVGIRKPKLSKKQRARKNRKIRKARQVAPEAEQIGREAEQVGREAEQVGLPIEPAGVGCQRQRANDQASDRDREFQQLLALVHILDAKVDALLARGSFPHYGTVAEIEKNEALEKERDRLIPGHREGEIWQHQPYVKPEASMYSPPHCAGRLEAHQQSSMAKESDRPRAP